MMPQKDLDTGILHTGLLQLPPGASILIDETQMQPGQLNETGLLNLKALCDLIETQKVYYDFKFQSVEMFANFNVIVMSSTNSLIKTNNAVMLKLPDNGQSIEASKCNLQPTIDELNRMRQYLTIAKILPYEVPLEMSELAQKHFVEARQANKQYTADNFHHLLNTARLVSLSQGNVKLNRESWDKAVSLVQ